MTKKELAAKVLDEKLIETAQEEARKKSALFKALNDKKFADLDYTVRDLTSQVLQTKLKGKAYDNLVQILNKASAERDEAFKSFYVPKQSKDLETRLREKLVADYGFNAPCEFDDKVLSFFSSDKAIQKRFKEIYQELGDYYSTFPKNKKPNRVLLGKPGTGKTYATKVIANNLLSRGFYVVHVTSDQLLKKFQSFVFDHKRNALDDVNDCDLLIIDDLGTEPTIPNVTEEHLFALINNRLVAEKPFIISTNLSVEQLNKKYDSRILSRIFAKETTSAMDFGTTDMRFN